MKIWALLALALSALALTVVRAEEEEEVGQERPGSLFVTEELTQKLFTDDVLGTSNLRLVFTTASMDVCPSCAAVAGEVEKAAKELADKYSIVTYAFDSDANPKLLKYTDSPGRPWLRMYFGESTPNPYNPGKPMREFANIFLDSFPTARQIKKAVFEAMPGYDRSLTSVAELDQIVQEGGSPTLLILTKHTGRNSTLTRSLAYSLKGLVNVVELPDKYFEDKFQEWKVEETPAAFMLDMDGASGSGVIPFEGDMKHRDEIIQFALKTSGLGVQEQSKTEDVVQSFQWVDGSDGVDRSDAGQASLVVAFVSARTSLEDEVPGWAKASNSFGGQVRALAVDCSEDACQGLEVPSIAVYGWGEEDSKSSTFPADELKEALRAVQDSLPSDGLLTFNASELSREMEEQMINQVLSLLTQQLGKEMLSTAILLVSSKKSEPPLSIQNIAASYPEDVKVVFVPGLSSETAASLGMQKVPGIVALLSSGDSQQMRAVPYAGRAMFSDLSLFIEALRPLVKVSGRPESSDEGQEATKGGGSGDSSVTEITAHIWGAEGAVEGICGTESSVLCALAAFEGPPSDEDMKVLQELAAVEASYSNSPWKFGYFDSLCQPDFASSFDIQPGAGASLVVFAPKKQRFARHFGRYELSELRKFLQQVILSKAPTVPMSERPMPVERDCASFAAEEAELVVEEDLGDLDDYLQEIRREEEEAKMQLEEELRREQEEIAAAKLAAASKASSKKKKKKKKKKAEPSGEL